MATFVLKWNPAISSYKMIDYLRELDMLLSGGSVQMDWSVWDYDKIKNGDTVYMLKVGYGATGIIGLGKVTSRAWQGDDWSGKGRKTYYVDFEPRCLLSPDCAPILDAETLATAIPDFDWSGGHSGLMLSESQEKILENLWKVFLKNNFGVSPKSKAPTIYVKSRMKMAKVSTQYDKEGARIGEMLFRHIMERRRHPIGYDMLIHSNKPTETAAMLLKADKYSPMYAYCNLECARQTLWKSPKFLEYLANAVAGFKYLQDSGAKIEVDLPDLEKSLAHRRKYADYIKEAEDKAERGELMDDLCELIDGYDIIGHGNMGSFHDSELISLVIDHEDDFAEIKFHMCNGADEILVVRFEGNLEYDIHGDEGGFAVMYLYGGYFYRHNDRVNLDLDPLGEISADHLKVVLFKPAPDED